MVNTLSRPLSLGDNPETNTQKKYLPPFPIPPGRTITELLETNRMSQVELSLRMGRPEQTVSEIINGKKEITENTAIQLEHIFGLPAYFWLELEQSYKQEKALYEG